MKMLVALCTLCLLAPAVRAQAEEGGSGQEVMVVDWDAQGTNMRDAPSGKVVHVIPFQGKKHVRMVAIQGQSKGWFNVVFEGRKGWMHGSILGTCASAKEDGDPALCKKPDNSSPATETIPSGAPVTLLDMHEDWLKVRYTDSKGKKHEGWLPQQSLMLSEGMQQECVSAWAKK